MINCFSPVREEYNRSSPGRGAKNLAQQDSNWNKQMYVCIFCIELGLLKLWEF